MATVHLLIKGRVQGVFYRATARRMADELGITGWINNTSEGNVELMATGREESLEQFITWCRKGPEMAAVTDVVISRMKPTPFKSFMILR
jgi:acylphosphatase